MGRQTNLSRSSTLPYFTTITILVITAVCLIGGYVGIPCSPWERCYFQYARYPGTGRQSTEATNNWQLTPYHGDSSSFGSRNDLDKCSGYHVTSIDDRLPGRLSMNLFLRGSPCDIYGGDVPHLKLEVTYESSTPTTWAVMVSHGWEGIANIV